MFGKYPTFIILERLYVTMIEVLFSPYLLLLNSLLFGFFTKYADLLDEHGLKLFPHADILFGILWGFFGILVILFNPLLASFYLAIILNWIVRGNIDYINHRIATVMILASVLFSKVIFDLDLVLFIVTFLLFTGIGLLIDHKKIRRNFLTNNNLFIFIALGVMVYYRPIYWIVIVSYFLNSLAYQSVKSWGKKNLVNY